MKLRLRRSEIAARRNRSRAAVKSPADAGGEEVLYEGFKPFMET